MLFLFVYSRAFIPSNIFPSRLSLHNEKDHEGTCICLYPFRVRDYHFSRGLRARSTYLVYDIPFYLSCSHLGPGQLAGVDDTSQRARETTDCSVSEANICCKHLDSANPGKLQYETPSCKAFPVKY